MDINLLLPREHVVLAAAAADRAALLGFLTAPLVVDGTVTDEGEFLAEVERREQQVTTQVAGGIAFPHARSHCVRRLGLVVGTVEAPGVPFGVDGREWCRLFLLIAIPASAPTAHLPLLKHLTGIVRQRARVARLLAARTPAQVLRLLATPRG